jgi:hypothetical protein
LEVETYADFEAIKERFKKFKSKLNELKTNFEKLTELADAAEESTDSSMPFIPTSENLAYAFIKG